MSQKAPAPHALAAALQERERLRGRKVAVVVSGGNVDRTLFAEVLTESSSRIAIAFAREMQICLSTALRHVALATCWVGRSLNAARNR
jgi:hypothetical protein